MLEIIDKGSSDSDSPALLFIHGAWHGAWCWDEHFLDFFAVRGFRALALSLRGHGNSPRDKPLSRCSIADYVDDVRSVADTLPTPPVVLGHSMGGFVMQKYLESNAAPAGVLLASAPPHGIRAASMRLLRRYPLATLQGVLSGSTMAAVNSPARVRGSMFSPTTPESLVVDYMQRFQQESKRVLLLDMPFRNLPKPERVTAPLLVLGAEHDGSFTVEEVHCTARAYRAEAHVFPGLGHDMMLEPGWQTVAERILDWLTTTLTPRRS